MTRFSDSSFSVVQARHLLRERQAKWARGMDRPTGGSPLQVARQRAAQRIAQSTREGDFVRVGVFRFAADVEQARWDRTSEIIERVQPGPFEDGNYLEFLARQAASVEMYLAGAGLDPTLERALDCILFGTTGEPTSRATTTRQGDAAVILMSAGMVYLMYQIAKAVTLAWKPLPAPKGSAVSLSTRLEDTRAVLDKDPRPAELAADTLLGWLFEGVARPPDSTAPAPIYHPPLSLLTSNSERFVIAHEYGHALVDQFRLLIPWVNGAEDLAPIHKEFRADLFATIVVAESAGNLDGVAPNIALQGAVLAMKAHEIADRAIDLARGGDGSPSWESTTHPPFNERARLVEEVYQSLVQGIRDERLAVGALHVPADTVELLWERMLPRLKTELNAGRSLHPIWERR